MAAASLARYYDPGNGRFQSEDQYAGQSIDIASHHRYSYANNNPLKYWDVPSLMEPPRGGSVLCQVDSGHDAW